jgi:hypothetical protein
MHTLHALPNHGTPSSTVPLLNTTTPVAQAEEPEYGEAYLKVWVGPTAAGCRLESESASNIVQRSVLSSGHHVDQNYQSVQPHPPFTSLHTTGSKIAFRCSLPCSSKPCPAQRRECAHEAGAPAVSHRYREGRVGSRGWRVEHGQTQPPPRYLVPHHTQLTKRQPSPCQDSWNGPSGLLGSTLWVDTHSSYDYTRGVVPRTTPHPCPHPCPPS